MNGWALLGSDYNFITIIRQFLLNFSPLAILSPSLTLCLARTHNEWLLRLFHIEIVVVL